jgi:hypothetical protein
VVAVAREALPERPSHQVLVVHDQQRCGVHKASL